MEIIMISDSKLKLMLAREDLAEFDLEADELDYSKSETKQMLWDILSDLREQVGFRTDGCRVLVQLFPSRDGGCEMFISKIADFCYCAEERTDTEHEILLPMLHCKSAHRSAACQGKVGVFAFDRLEWMITVCRRLRGIGYGEDSRAYISDDHRYFLFLEGLDPLGYLTLDEYSFIAEYGSVENADALTGYLCEHGRLLCESDAVERLGVL